ncbi:Uncharacterised protein [Burkholderia pseudomallei]|uniref:hypothetical protein n=1 Tax=Burkholderia pseudomallei TaxID=28450 RepID=UPI0005E85493|nr:hypothetical protein [Burkholderia pseudomallei]QUN86035.1 hypothetical protein KEX46_14345 [Burkholderia pseudomallei]CPH56561.1 Uncharacterised protein [Burkholderia pseudomallei]
MSIYLHRRNEGPNTVRLGNWSIREFENGARHFVGYNLETRDGRVSTAIVALDVASRMGRTESGRIYVLEGRSGYHRDAEYVFDRVAAIIGDGAPWRDVTAELIPDCRVIRHRSKDAK